MKFERDSLPGTRVTCTVGYTVGLRLTDGGALVAAAYPAATASPQPLRVFLPHTCDRDRRGAGLPPSGVELVAA